VSDQYEQIRSLSFPALAAALGLDISDYKQRKHGQEWYGACPVHRPKQNSTSFSYNQSGAYFCFSCNAKGRGALDLTKAVKACGFKEAVAFLEPFVGKSVQTAAHNEKTLPEGKGEAAEGILKPFVGKYHLHQAECDWLNHRCPDKAVRERYGVFFYQNNARKSNVNGHVLIPIRDIDGVLYGYLARNIGEVTQERPKYRLPANLPKSKFLFGASQIKASQPLPLKVVYVVESWLSVLHFASFGVPALSPFGWSLATEQLLLLPALTRGVVYLPDRNKTAERESIAGKVANTLWVHSPELPEGIDDPVQLSLEQIQALTH
jgi:DNA primase